MILYLLFWSNFIIKNLNNPSRIFTTFAFTFPALKKSIVKLRQGSGKEGQGMALEAKGLKALNPCLELTLKLVATTTTTHPPGSLNTLA